MQEKIICVSRQFMQASIGVFWRQDGNGIQSGESTVSVGEAAMVLCVFVVDFLSFIFVFC